jgi:hypothetical protein
MKSTIRTEAGCAVITSLVGRVQFNDGSMLPHEAYLVGSELQRAAEAANVEAARAANGDQLPAAPALAA